MSTQTLEQTRAKFAYECVEKIASDNQNIIPKKKFKGLVKRTPTYILTNGLGNTLAFLFSKGNNEHLALAYIIGRYLFKENEYIKNVFNKLSSNFFTEIDSAKEFIEKKQNLEKFLDSLEDIIKEIEKTNNQLGREQEEDEKRKIKNNLEMKKEEYKNKLEDLKENFENIINIDLFRQIEQKNFSKNRIISHLIRDPIFQNLVFTDTDKYILATEETLRLLNWLKRFVEAMIEGEEE